MKTLVLGLGNPILTDDGVGVLVAEEVRARLPEDTPIDIIEVSVGGLTLMETMIGYDRVILVDAFQRLDGCCPGKVHKMSLEDLRSISPTQHSASPHDTSLVTALEMGHRMGLQLPQDITIFAIEVENVMDFSDRPTPSVAAAIPQVTEAVLDEIAL
ncbi:MAG: hydrogenase maturation protease [Anaerolineales bacterium]|nr:hydrogenase maturation protease [Anaerolineales bacterium]